MMHKDFNELTKKVEELSKDELERANKQFPLFHSRHEGWGVLSEELWEFSEEIETVSRYIKEIQKSTYTDGESEHFEESATMACFCMIQAISELIQAAAMCQKLIQSEQAKSSNEHSKCDHPVRYSCNGNTYCPKRGSYITDNEVSHDE